MGGGEIAHEAGWCYRKNLNYMTYFMGVGGSQDLKRLLVGV